MRKLKAYFLRWCHLMASPLMPPYHLAYTEGKAILFCGIEIWFVAKKIECTCGKSWYDEDNKK